jgi:hypothetical protein
MKRAFTVVLGTLLVLALSVPVFAQVHGTIDFGSNNDSGAWGFTYYRELGAQQGTIQPYMNIKKNSSRFNKAVPGAYVDGGQRLMTMIGNKLGVNYSSYIASFHNDNRHAGLRIQGYKLNTPFGELTFDGTYVFALAPDDPGSTWQPPAYEGKKDILLGMTGNIDPLSATIKAAARYINYGADNWFWDYSVELNTTIIPKVTINAVRAGYLEKNDWLHEITANWKVIPGTLEVKGGYRNSQIDSVDYLVYKGGVVATPAQQDRYINDAGRNAINAIFNRDESYNVGATLWFDLGAIENKLDIGYDTTNPAKRGDFDDQVSVSLETNYKGFSIKQSADILIPDPTTDPANRNSAINDPDLYRYDYRLAITTPSVSLPFGISANGLINYDWDSNYLAYNRDFTAFGVKLSTTKDIFKMRKIVFDAYAFVDVPGEPVELNEWDLFKYVVRARYTAPNNIRFQAEYVSSENCELNGTWVHNEPLYKRYAPYLFHPAGSDSSPDRFSGFRFIVGIPF